MGSVQNMPGGDFNHNKTAWYWKKEEATVEKDGRWGEVRSPWAEKWIIRIQVPKAFIDNLCKRTLRYSPDWKEYVWYCRKGGSVGEPPAKFDQLWKDGQAQLVAGHVCMHALAVIPRIKKKQLQKKISEDEVMYIKDRRATQSVYMDTGVVHLLRILARDKVCIDMSPAVSPPKEHRKLCQQLLISVGTREKGPHRA
jgi:hypothetical protein